MTLEDKLAADAFGKSYREFLALKPTHVRWSKLAPQAVLYLREAQERHWSMEKLSDYLHGTAEEAEVCFRRFVMSKQVNEREGTAERIRQAFFEWTGRFSEDEKEREHYARELALLVANQLHSAALSGEELDRISLDLEGAGQEPGKESGKPPEEPRKWGPQWKD